MRRLVVFEAEARAGLAERIACSGPVSLAGEIALPDAPDLTAHVPAARTLCRATNLGQADLLYLESVLVTAGWEMTAEGLPAGWNRNDDVFDPQEVWSARHTPEDKPVNDEHSSSAVIGHITSNVAWGPSGVLPDDTTVDNLPARFHLVTGSVLYRVWREEAVKKKVNAVVAEVLSGKRFVSMECLLGGFDYCLVEGGVVTVVPRTRETSHLSAHLKHYGGSGEVDGRRIGRVLRNLTFSGMGVVRRPANPDSVILSVGSVGENDRPAQELGYCTATEPAENLMNETEQLAQLQAQHKELSDELAGARSLLQQAQAALAESAAAAAALQTERDALAAERDAVRAELVRERRVQAVTERIGLDKAKACEMVDALTQLADDKFEAHLQSVAALQKTRVTAADLSQATPAADAALAVPSNDAVNAVRQQIALYFGRSEDTKN